MGHCRKCGDETIPGDRICYSCREKWKERRLAVFTQALAEIGPLTAETHEAILARVKQLEKQK